MSDSHTIEISALAHGGAGIGRIEGQVVFVPGTVPGDTVRVAVTKRTKNALFGELQEIVTASPDRATPPCPNFGRCGGCTWSHVAYPAQATWKQDIVRQSLRRLAGADVEVGWVEDASLRLGYRTRAELHGDGKHLGFFQPGSHTILQSTECPTCHPNLNTAWQALMPLGIKGTVTVTVNPEGEEVLVWTQFVKRKLNDRFPLTNTPNDPERHQFLFDGIPIVNGTFSQASLLLNRLLQRETRKAIGKADSLLDLYCGNGNLSLPSADSMRVVGADHNRAAIRAARNAGRGDYRTGGEEIMKKLLVQEPWDVILLDPPRTGAKELAPAMAKADARAIVYVSCDPATLARDIKTLEQGGWQPMSVTAVDLFPNTPHVETVCRLERVSG